MNIYDTGCSLWPLLLSPQINLFTCLIWEITKRMFYDILHVTSSICILFYIQWESFENEVLSWGKKLNRIYALFDNWLDVQRRWLYLEGIFTASADIKQFENETYQFPRLTIVALYKDFCWAGTPERLLSTNNQHSFPELCRYHIAFWHLYDWNLYLFILSVG